MYWHIFDAPRIMLEPLSQDTRRTVVHTQTMKNVVKEKFLRLCFLGGFVQNLSREELSSSRSVHLWNVTNLYELCKDLHELCQIRTDFLCGLDGNRPHVVFSRIHSKGPFAVTLQGVVTGIIKSSDVCPFITLPVLLHSILAVIFCR